MSALKSEAYGDLDVSEHVIDSGGWMDPSFVSVFTDAVSARDRARDLQVIEVGSWKGRSALAMAGACRAGGFARFTIVAVDTWLGAPEFWTWGLSDPTRGVALKRVGGYPTVFRTFTSNAKKAGFGDHIAPFPISSVQGADVLKHYGCRADVIYLDAAHEYEAVIADLRAYLPLLAPDGVLLGDDYMPNWPGVVRAVDEIAAAEGLRLDVTGVVWKLTWGGAPPPPPPHDPPRGVNI